MSGSDTIHVPEVPPGKLGFMIYEPYFSKKKGAWVPGGYPSHTKVVFCTKQELIDRFLAKPDIVADKGLIRAISPGLLFDGSDRRANRNVRNVQFIGMDVDSADKDDLEYMTRVLVHADLEFVLYSTVSNGMPGKGTRWRIIIFLSEPVPAHLATRFIQEVIDLYGRNAKGEIIADKSCTDAARVYFAPAAFAANAHLHFSYYHPGMELQVEEIYDRISATSTTVAMNRSDADRVATIASARASLAPSARGFGKAELEALAKNKKASLTEAQRAALRAAAQGQRMVVCKGEREPAALKASISHGGDLEDGDIDVFLTSLMFKVAVHHRNADPSNVEAAFAPSLSVLIDDDTRAGNPTYAPDALRLKFETGVRAADEKAVEEAKAAGLPTVAEFRAEHAPDEGDLSKLLPGRVFLGARCFFMVTKGEGDEPKLVPVSNFSIIPRERLVSETSDDLRRVEELYLVDFISYGKGGTVVERRVLPPEVLMTKRSFNEYLSRINPLSWWGSDDQAQHVRVLLLDYVHENKIPQKRMTYRLGLRRDGSLVTPHGSYKWTGGFAVEVDEDAPTYAPSAMYESNEKIKQETERRGVEVDIEAIRVFCSNITRIMAPGVAWAVAGWANASVQRDTFDQFPIIQVVGTKGSGKSTIARRWKEALAGSEVAVGGMPRYSQARELTANTSHVVVYEEFRWSKHHSTQALRDTTRDNYARQSLSRSGFKTLQLEAPMMIVGEHELARGPDGTDGATLQRMVIARPETTMINGPGPEVAARRAAFAALGDCPIIDSGYWAHLACWQGAKYPPKVAHEILRRMRAAVEAHVATLPTNVRGALDERTRYNLAMVLFGCFKHVEYCNFIGADPGPVPSVAEICRDTIATVTGTGLDDTPDEQSDPLARYVEALTRVLAEESGGNPQLNMRRWWLREGDMLYIDVSGSLTFYNKHGGGDATYASQAAIYQFARESPFALRHPKTAERHRKRIQGSSVSQSRCVALSIERLEEANVSLSEAFLVDSAASAEGGFGA